MTPDTTIILLRALARGSTGAELEQAAGLTIRAIQRRLLALEAAGVEIERPSGTRWEPPGIYRLRDPRQVLEP